MPPPIILRVNTIKNSAKELSEKLSSSGKDNEIFSQNTIILKSGFNVENFEPYKKGLFFIQDLSSQTTGELLGVQKNDRVLDMCAAPGGKSFSMALLMENCGEIVSCDIHPHRTELIKKGARRLGLDIIKPTVQDATQFNAEMGVFDKILCDVPCSGFGIIRRKPDIKYNKTENFEELENVQYQILSNSVNYLKENGIIVYSTCTVRKSENERIVNKFLENHKDFKLISMETVMPSENGGDGFFKAKLAR